MDLTMPILASLAFPEEPVKWEEYFVLEVGGFDETEGSSLRGVSHTDGG